MSEQQHPSTLNEATTLLGECLDELDGELEDELIEFNKAVIDQERYNEIIGKLRRIYWYLRWMRRMWNGHPN